MSLKKKTSIEQSKTPNNRAPKKNIKNKDGRITNVPITMTPPPITMARLTSVLQAYRVHRHGYLFKDMHTMGESSGALPAASASSLMANTSAHPLAASGVWGPRHPDEPVYQRNPGVGLRGQKYRFFRWNSISSTKSIKKLGAIFFVHLLDTVRVCERSKPDTPRSQW